MYQNWSHHKGVLPLWFSLIPFSIKVHASHFTCSDKNTWIETKQNDSWYEKLAVFTDETHFAVVLADLIHCTLISLTEYYSIWLWEPSYVAITLTQSGGFIICVTPSPIHMNLQVLFSSRTEQVMKLVPYLVLGRKFISV